jgi:enamine deaminase RidA (YjgF/YER057c/UK114 family)
VKRENFSSDSPWEDIVGYSRAVRVGNTLEISGTVALNDQNKVIGAGDPYTQTYFILSKIEKICVRAGFTLRDIVRTRLYVTDISKWEEFGKAHGEYFKNIKPCTSMIEVSRLISEDYLVEIEVTAVLSK